MSMLSGLQPRSTPELLDLAVRLVRARFWPLVGLMALLTLPTVGLQAIGFSLSLTPMLRPLTSAPAELGAGALLGGLLQNLASLLQALLLQGLAPLVVAQALADELSGERHSLVATLRRLASRWAEALVLLVLLVGFGLVAVLVLAAGGAR